MPDISSSRIFPTMSDILYFRIFPTMPDISYFRILPNNTMHSVLKNMAPQFQISNISEYISITSAISYFRIFFHNVRYFLFQNIPPQCEMWDWNIKMLRPTIWCPGTSYMSGLPNIQTKRRESIKTQNEWTCVSVCLAGLNRHFATKRNIFEPHSHVLSNLKN